MIGRQTGAYDRGLVIRVAVSLTLLAAFTVAFVAFCFWLVEELLLHARGADVRFVTRSSLAIAGTTLVLLLAGAAHGYRRTLDRVGAAVASREEHADLYATANRLSAGLDVPAPRLAIVESDVPNSLAVGRPSNATVVVSTALLEALDDEEVESVLAHELAHVANYDAVVMELAGALAGLTERIVRSGARLTDRGAETLVPARREGYALPRDRQRDEELGDIAVYGIVVGAIAVALAVPFWMAARTVHRLLSRYRELAADRVAAVLTGDPAALASALEKLEDATPPTADARALDGTRAMCILPYEFELVPEPEVAFDEIELPSLRDDEADSSTEPDRESALADWDRIDEIERMHRSQPMHGVDPRDPGLRAEAAEPLLRFPGTHPPVSKRRERLLALQRELA